MLARWRRSGLGVDAGEDLAEVVAAAGFGQDGVDAAAEQRWVIDFGGVAGYEHVLWNAVFAPARTPKNLIARVDAELAKAVNAADVRERFAAIGDEPAGGTPEEFAETIRKDSAKWKEVVQRSGARLD